MEYISNYHTHSNLCDGADTLEDMAEAGFKAGLRILGFSGHCYTAYDESYCMTKAGTEEYMNRISALKEKYAGQMNILCGIEQDFGSDEPVDAYDYVIGSVHAIFPKADENSESFHGYDRSRYFYIDWDMDCIHEAIEKDFGGDPYAFIERYYETVALLPEATHCNIIGHFDLITKFIEEESWFDENHPRYIKASSDALDTLLEKGMIFEINTGAIARGKRKVPYPSERLLRRIGEKGGRVVVNSDSHSTGSITCAFEEAYALAEKCGCRIVTDITI